VLIGALARQSGVSTSRIRFYERRGLLPAARRLANGYRDYPDEIGPRLRLIVKSQELGFSLAEIGKALPEFTEAGVDYAQVVLQLRRKLEELDAHIEDLRAVRGRVEAMLEHVEGVGEPEASGTLWPSGLCSGAVRRGQA